MIKTPRFLLRRWTGDDRQAFARINSDARVMEFMPKCLTREESDHLVDRIERNFATRGFGLFAVEFLEEASLVGFVGLSEPAFQAHFTPCIEIGWRLSAYYWGRGLATEAARAVVTHAFETLRLESLVSFTVPANIKSRRVMEKIGMSYSSSDDFDHPNLPEGHPLRRHVLYRLRRSEWHA